jgi:hypothetical protein
MTSRKLLISADRLAAIRSRVSMPALVAEDVAVQRAGRGEFLTACPFHIEQTPSFRIYRDHAHCYGCGWHGDQIGWLMAHARLGFVGAVHRLCNWAGIADPVGVDLEIGRQYPESDWRPIHPIPLDAPPLISGGGALPFKSSTPNAQASAGNGLRGVRRWCTPTAQLPARRWAMCCG